jgi:hypothetical protein
VAKVHLRGPFWALHTKMPNQARLSQHALLIARRLPPAAARNHSWQELWRTLAEFGPDSMTCITSPECSSTDEASGSGGETSITDECEKGTTRGGCLGAIIGASAGWQPLPPALLLWLPRHVRRIYDSRTAVTSRHHQKDCHTS